MTSLLARSFTLAVLGISAALVPLTVQAQVGAAVRPDSVAVRAVDVPRFVRDIVVDSLSVAGPRIVRAGAVPVVLRSVPASPQRSSAHVGAGSNVALMGVGLAGVVIGILVGGDGGAMISIGGGALGLYGLFRYLR